MPSTNPRAICLEALLQWENSRRFADEILHDILLPLRLSPLDRAFLMELFYGIIRNLSSLDFLISKLRDESLDHKTRTLLRLGLYQIFHMRVPPHAAVNETVDLSSRARGLVNAILRRSLREKSALEAALEKSPPAVRLSHPEFLFRKWEKDWGTPSALELCKWNNQPPDLYIRANELKVTRGELLKTVQDAETVESHPLVLRVKQLPFFWIINGLAYVQDPSTLTACDLLNPQPGDNVLDACAAPGGKTSYMAQLMGNEGHIIASDVSQKRLLRLQENLQRLGVTNTTLLQSDWVNNPAKPNLLFDKILLDVPCSNTGVIQRRIDVRWRLSDRDFEELPKTQLAIIRNVLPLLKQGGILVYSTCSLEKEENEELVDKVIQQIPELEFVELRKTVPVTDKIDGSFAAKFRRI